MSARRIHWSHFSATSLPAAQVCARVGTNVARALVQDLTSHRAAQFDLLARRVGPIGRTGRRRSQFRRDMEGLIVPTLGVAREENGWLCLTPGAPAARPDDFQLGLERIDRDGIGVALDVGLSIHAIARLAQRRIGTNPDALLDAARHALRATLRLQQRPDCRRTRADLEARFPTSVGTWAAIRRGGAWTVTTFLDAEAVPAPCVRPLRHEQDRAAGMERSHRLGHRGTRERGTWPGIAA